MSVLALLQDAAIVVADTRAPILTLSQVFPILFVVMGPPLKTPAVYYARTLEIPTPRWICMLLIEEAISGRSTKNVPWLSASL